MKRKWKCGIYGNSMKKGNNQHGEKKNIYIYKKVSEVGSTLWKKGSGLLRSQYLIDGL